MRSIMLSGAAVMVCVLIALTCADAYAAKKNVNALLQKAKSGLSKAKAAACGDKFPLGCMAEMPCCCKPTGPQKVYSCATAANCPAGREDVGHHDAHFAACRPVAPAALYDAKIRAGALNAFEHSGVGTSYFLPGTGGLNRASKKAWDVYGPIVHAGAPFFAVGNSAAMAAAKEELITLHGENYDTHFGFAVVFIETNGGAYQAVVAADNSQKMHTEKWLLQEIDKFVAALKAGGLTVRSVDAYFVLDKTPCSAGPNCLGYIAAWEHTNRADHANVHHQYFTPKKRHFFL